MLRRGTVLLFLWTILLSAAPAQAQWFSRFCDSICRDYKRNQAWPEPFLMADREAVNLPFGIQVANGWRRQNLMSDYYFKDDAPQLTQAGEMKIHFILTQMPPQRRTIFVQRGMSPEVTATRMDIVQRAAGRLAVGGGWPEVVESDLPNDGWPAEEVDSVTRKFQDSRPDPRIKTNSDASQTSAGGGNH